VNVEKIPVEKISETVARQIEKMIESEKFKAGEKLPSIRELCELFGVGRSAVRDAIILLQGKGLVNIKQGEGSYVCSFDSTKLFNNSYLLLPNSENISELFQIRKLLEPGIAEMSALNRTDDDLKIMEDLIANRSSNGWEADYDFHMIIAKSTRNKIVYQLLQSISNTLEKSMIDFHNYIQQDTNIVELIDKQHIKIYEYIKLKEPKKTNEMMLEHLNLVEELLQKSVLQESSN